MVKFADAQITVTTNETVLNKDLFSACAVDFGFTGNFVSRNVLADPYFSDIKGIGFCNFNFSGISTADYAHNNGGDGYSCNPLCPDQDGGKRFGKSFFDEFFSFTSAIEVPSTYIANVQTGTIDEVYKALDKGCKTIIWGGEQNLSENGSFYPDGGNTYRSKINASIDSVDTYYANVTHIVDAAPTWIKTAKVNSDWNKTESGIEGDAARMYIWNDDANVTDVTTLNTFFSTTLKNWENNFLSYFPEKNIAVVQFGWKASSTGINSGLNSLYLAKGFKYFLENQSLYSFASFMSLKSLDTYTNNKATLKLIGQLFANDNLVVTTSPYANIEAITTEINGKYTVLIINTGSLSQSVSIVVDGKKKSATYNGNYFTSPTSTVLNTYSGSGKTFDVKGYSVTIATF